MPLYVYQCPGCSLQFEEVRKHEDRDNKITCPDCGYEESGRVIAVPFGIQMKLDPKRDTIYTPKEIDKVVGEDANKKWEGYDERWKKRYEERQKNRWAKMGANPSDINMPRDKDGKYSPLMHLGDKKDREFKKDYSEALREHREERKKKGISQFDGMKDRDSVIKYKPKNTEK